MKSISLFLLSFLFAAIGPAETGLTEAEATGAARQWATQLTGADAHGLETLLASNYKIGRAHV